MSPRAAWRLETLGFKDVSDYVDGKVDWLAAGLPTEGTNAKRPRAGDVARKDAPTCRLEERLGDVSERATASGWEAAVVVNEEKVVLGLLRKQELAGDPAQSVERAMRPGPSTFRPYVEIEKIAEFMVSHNVDTSPITTSDGRLVGLVRKDDALRVAHDLHLAREGDDKAP
jgi:predicted transcriptional regulator